MFVTLLAHWHRHICTLLNEILGMHSHKVYDALTSRSYNYASYCFVVVVSSFLFLNSLQWNRVPSILPMKTKSQGNECDPVNLLPFQLNKNDTTTHRVLLIKIQNQKSFKSSYHIYYTRHIHNCTWDQQSINSSKPL